MLQFIATEALMISLGVILYLVIRTLPRIEEENLPPLKRGIFERWFTSEIPERLDKISQAILEKLFRKLKVFLLRLDNILTERLRKIKPADSENGKPKMDFSELTGSRSESTDINGRSGEQR